VLWGAQRSLALRRLRVARKNVDGHLKVDAVQEHDEIDCAGAFGTAAATIKNLLDGIDRESVCAAANRTRPGEVALAFELKSAVADDRQNVDGLGALQVAREHAHGHPRFSRIAAGRGCSCAVRSMGILKELSTPQNVDNSRSPAAPPARRVFRVWGIAQARSLDEVERRARLAA
jgi:hypothetical protein